MKLYPGLKFTSKYFEGVSEILSIAENENAIKVKLPSGPTEQWDLEHTLWGFDRKDYFLYFEKDKTRLENFYDSRFGINGTIFQIIQNSAVIRIPRDLEDVLTVNMIPYISKRVCGINITFINNDSATPLQYNLLLGIDIVDPATICCFKFVTVPTFYPDIDFSKCIIGTWPIQEKWEVTTAFMNEQLEKIIKEIIAETTIIQ